MLVYIVEDSDDIIEVEKYALERIGYEVEGFSKSKPFFDRVRAKKPDMILLDVFIYEENGYDVLSRLRTSVDTKNIPVIMVYGDCDDIVPYDEKGAILEKYYRENGGTIIAIGKENCGHHPHGLEDHTPLIEFAEKYCK